MTQSGPDNPAQRVHARRREIPLDALVSSDLPLGIRRQLTAAEAALGVSTAQRVVPELRRRLHQSRAGPRPVAEPNDLILYGFFDQDGSVVLHPTAYMRALRLSGRTPAAMKTHATAVAQHLKWIRLQPLFVDHTIDDVIAEIYPDMIREWVQSLMDANLERSTVHTTEAIVKSFYVWLTCSESGPIRDDVPWPGVRRYVSRGERRGSSRVINTGRYALKDDLIVLLQHLHNESQRCLGHFLYDTGLRISEALRVIAADLRGLDDETTPLELRDLQYLPLAVRGSKSRDRGFKERITLMSRAMLTRLQRYHATPEYRLAPGWEPDDPAKPLFLSVHGTVLTDDAFRKSLRAACLRAGRNGDPLTPHRLRHGCAVSVMRSELGENYTERLVALRAMLGHSTIDSTQIYTGALPLIEAIRSSKGIIERYREAEDILRQTYLTRREHSERRGHTL